VMSSAAGLMEIRTQAERDSRTGPNLFGFFAEPVFTFIPESSSRSPRNRVRDHPGIAFMFPRIPHSPTQSALRPAIRVVFHKARASIVDCSNLYRRAAQHPRRSTYCQERMPRADKEDYERSHALRGMVLRPLQGRLECLPRNLAAAD